MQNKTAKIIHLIKTANSIVTATVEDTEELLLHAEAIVKDFVPAKYQKSALNRLAEKLRVEGIKSNFDTKLTKEVVEKTASIEADGEEVLELVNAIRDAVVAELEDTLADTDEVADMEVEKCGCEEEKREQEARLKSIIERKLRAEGITCRMARLFKKEMPEQEDGGEEVVAKKTLLQKVVASAKK